MADDFTARFRVDISDLKAGLTSARKEIKQANAEFKASTAGMDSWKKDADGLTAKLKQLDTVLNQQKAILENYKNQLKQQQTAYEENGKRAEQLRQKLADLASQGVDKASDEYKKYESALKRVESEQERNEKAVQSLNEKIRAQDTAITATENETQKWTRHLEQLQAEEVDTARTTEQLEGATSKLEGGFSVLNGAAASLVADGLRKIGSAMKDVITDGAKYADTINTLSSTTSVSTDTLQKLNYMSGLVDVDVNTVAKSMQKLTKNMASAQGGSKSMTANFEELGVKITDANGNLRDNEEVFYDVIAALGKMENETERDAAAMEIFGKSATALNPLIEAGAEQIAAWSKEAEDAGYIMSEDMISGLVKVQDEFDRFDGTTQVVKNNLAAGLAPALEKGTKKLNEMVSSNNWKKVGEDLGGMMTGLIDAFSWIIDNGDMIKAILAGILAAFAAQKIIQAVDGIKKMTKALLTMNAAANANPYVILIGVIVALGAAFVAAAKSVDENYKSLDNEWNAVNKLKDETTLLTEEINANKEATDAARQAREDSMNAGLAEMAAVQGLADELKTLADENGNVTDKNKARAQFILNELNSALGTEYTMNGNVIESYKEIQGAIDETIEKQKAEIILQAQREAYAAAITGQADAERELMNAVNERAAVQAQYDELEAERLVAQQNMNAAVAAGSGEASRWAWELDQINQKEASLTETMAEADAAVTNSADIVDQYAHDVQQYTDNMTAALEGDYKKIQYQSWETAKAQGEASTEASKAVKEKATDATTNWLRQLGDLVTKTTGKKTEFKEVGNGMIQAFVDGQKEGEQKPVTEMQQIASKMLEMERTGINQISKAAGYIPSGIAQEIYAGSDQAIQAIGWLAQQMQIKFNQTNEAKSPSRKYMRYTSWILQGIVNEINKDGYQAENAMGTLADDMSLAFRQGINAGQISGVAGAMRNGSQIYGSGSSSKVINQNFVQNNYSPKAQDRVQIYRNTNNLLALARAEA